MEFAETYQLSEMSEEQVDEALAKIHAVEKDLRLQRRELLNRKAFLNAKLYVVATIGGQATIHGVSDKYKARTSRFELRTVPCVIGEVDVILEREDNSMTFRCSVNHGLSFSEGHTHEDEEGKARVRCTFHVFSNLASAEEFVQRINERKLPLSSPQ